MGLSLSWHTGWLPGMKLVTEQGSQECLLLETKWASESQVLSPKPRSPRLTASATTNGPLAAGGRLLRAECSRLLLRDD